MPKVNIRPLSVNRAYQGRRFSTPEHKQFIHDMMLMLPRLTLPEPPFHISYKFGYSSPLNDVDGGIKMAQDCIAKKYGFNDRSVFSIYAEKELVSKGQEYIEFEIESFSER